MHRTMKYVSGGCGSRLHSYNHGDSGVKHMGQGAAPSTDWGGGLDAHLKRNEPDLYLSPCKKLNSKWIKGLGIKRERLKP